MKVKLNPMFEQASGLLGDIVFREVRGKTFAGRKPSGGGEPTADQTAQRELFKQAAAYGKAALADPAVRALYEAAAKDKDMPVFALTVADFFNAPTVDNVDLSAYNGQVNDLIHVIARDDFGVASVLVSIADQTGHVIDAGNAVETAAGSGHWVYSATATIATGITVTVSAIATDRPGGTAVKTANKSI